METERSQHLHLRRGLSFPAAQHWIQRHCKCHPCLSVTADTSASPSGVLLTARAGQFHVFNIAMYHQADVTTTMLKGRGKLHWPWAHQGGNATAPTEGAKEVAPHMARANATCSSYHHWVEGSPSATDTQGGRQATSFSWKEKVAPSLPMQRQPCKWSILSALEMERR